MPAAEQHKNVEEETARARWEKEFTDLNKEKAKILGLEYYPKHPRFDSYYFYLPYQQFVKIKMKEEKEEYEQEKAELEKKFGTVGLDEEDEVLTEIEEIEKCLKAFQKQKSKGYSIARIRIPIQKKKYIAWDKKTVDGKDVLMQNEGESYLVEEYVAAVRALEEVYYKKKRESAREHSPDNYFQSRGIRDTMEKYKKIALIDPKVKEHHEQILDDYKKYRNEKIKGKRKKKGEEYDKMINQYFK